MRGKFREFKRIGKTFFCKSALYSIFAGIYLMYQNSTVL
jgi:hypothetical protein